MDEDRENIERRIAAAKRSMSTRLAELGERLDETRRSLSLRQRLQEHPLLILGAAAAVGLWFGRSRTPRSVALVPSPRRGLMSTAVHEIFRSLLTTVAASVATHLVDRMNEAEGGQGTYGPVGDPEHRTTGVRIYPLT
jgi:hypothetical protein